MAKFATLIENFQAGGLDPDFATDGANVVYGSGVVTLGIFTAQNNLKTSAAWDLTSSQIHAQVTWPATGAGGHQCSFRVSLGPTATDTANEIRFFRNGTNLMDCRYTIAGAATTLASLTYDPVAHAWLRFRHSGSTVFWETAPDGVTWTTRASTAAITWDLANVFARWTGVMFGAETGVVVVDNVNVVGPPVVTAKIEVEFVPGSGTFVDISNRCSSVTISRPRPGVAQGAAVTTLTAELDNAPDSTGFCPFTPDSATAANYPNIERDRLVRVTAMSGPSSWVRFFGWSDTWVPDLGAGGVGQSTVTLTASCVLSRYARRRMMSMFGERVITYDPLALYYPFDDSPDSDVVRVVSSTMAGANPGEMVAPSRYPGSASFASPDGGHLTDGQIDFTRGSDNAPAPVVLLKLRDPALGLPEYIMGWYKLSSDPAGSLGDDMIAAYDASGKRLWVWSVKVVSGLVSWVLYDDTSTSRSFIDTGAPRDEGWHYWAIWLTSATNTNLFTRTKGDTGQVAAGSSTWPYDPRPVQYLVVGGQMVPARKGKQSNTFQGSISSLAVEYDAVDFATYANPGIVVESDFYRAALSTISAPIDALVGGAFSAADLTPVSFTTAPGDLLERFNELVVTIGGALFTRPDGRRHYRPAAGMRSPTVALTLDAAADLHMPAGGWQAVRDERPTRVTASAPVGSITVTDTATEAATGLRLEGPTVATAAGTIGVAQSVAAWVMAHRASRLSSFGVDVTLTATDKTAAIMALLPGDRMRVDGLPTEYMGVSYVDVYASGWTESYIADGNLAQFVFDTDAADDPPEAILDNAEYSRIGMGDGAATITGGTCVGTTGTGTVIITSTSVLTTVGGEYSLDLDWLGERITVNVPGGGTSPQTCTVTARGVAPTVARVHAAGEAVEVWRAARVAL
jgi:hypothetical protein